MHAIAIDEKKRPNLEESGDGYMEVLRGGKGRKKCFNYLILNVVINTISKINKSKNGSFHGKIYLIGHFHPARS